MSNPPLKDAYFNSLFDDYKSLLTTGTQVEYLTAKLKESIRQKRRELSLFIAGFLDLESGRLEEGKKHFEDNTLRNRKYKLLGLAIAYYIQAQRQYSERLCEKALNRLKKLQQEFPGLVGNNWFIPYKLGKVYCLLGDLHEKKG